MSSSSGVGYGRGRGIVRRRGGHGRVRGGHGGSIMEDSVSLTSTIALSPLDYLANGWSNTFRKRGNIIIEINLLYIDLFSLHMENL
jgi:hypothetical protein